MATETVDASAEIGQTAGLVWKYLAVQGATSLTKLTREIDAPRDLVMQALGWLAREDKVQFDSSGRTKSVRLR
jgi:hypothetical protein